MTNTDHGVNSLATCTIVLSDSDEDRGYSPVKDSLLKVLRDTNYRWLSDAPFANFDFHGLFRVLLRMRSGRGVVSNATSVRNVSEIQNKENVLHASGGCFVI